LQSACSVVAPTDEYTERITNGMKLNNNVEYGSVYHKLKQYRDAAVGTSKVVENSYNPYGILHPKIIIARLAKEVYLRSCGGSAILKEDIFATNIIFKDFRKRPIKSWKGIRQSGEYIKCR